MLILQTERVQLKSLEAGDISRLHEIIFSDPAVMRYAFGGKTFTPEQTEAFVAEYFAEAGSMRGLGVLFLRKNDQCIGFAGLLPCRLPGEAIHYELGFMLSAQVWGEGYATEIGQAQIALAASLGESRVLALVNPDNAASKATIARLGMCYYKTVNIEGRGVREVYKIDRDKQEKA